MSQNINMPMYFLQMMRQGKNPQQLMFNMMTQSASNNPILSNLLSLAQQGKSADIEKVARNLLSSQGYDFDKEFASFRTTLGF